MPFLILGWILAIALGSYVLASIIVALWAWIAAAIVAVCLFFVVAAWLYSMPRGQLSWRGWRSDPPAKERA